MSSVENLAQQVGTAAACQALGVARASYYRHQARRHTPVSPAPRPRPPLALTAGERQQVLAVLHSDRFVDQAPHTVYATLLDEGQYLCSVRTMYRLLDEADEVRERRNQCRRPVYAKPELLATAPNQLWSWDITKLKGPEKWTYFYLYVILDIFSRYVVGWMVAHRETAELAKRLIAETCQKQNIVADQLTVHADRGASMTSKSVAHLLADLGITKSHSRPSVSNDNPFSEAQFKTLKYRPAFPERFGCIEHARQHAQAFFPWYNTEHYHCGIALLTPETVHYGLADAVLEKRAQTLHNAFLAHPERFKGRPPQPLALPKAVWINKPEAPSEPETNQPQEDLDLLQ